MLDVEWIREGDQLLAMILRRELVPEATTFLTPSDFPQQVGLIVYPKGGQVVPHIHLPVERHITGTSEVLFVRRGVAEVDFFDRSRQIICTRELREGDLLLIVEGGHGLRFTEDTVLVEVKQGPYVAGGDKERFEV